VSTEKQHLREKQYGGHPDFAGIFALLLTPFRSDGRIDWACFDHYMDWQLSHHPHGLFAVCGSSEMAQLSLEERLALARRTAERAGRVPVLATANLEGDRSLHADEVARMTATGVAGVVLVPPDGLGRNQNELLDYLARLADQASCPVILYEWPQMRPCEITPETYATLVREHGVRGIKDTTCTLEGIQAKIEAAPASIVYQANTPYLLEAVRLGAQGALAITSTAATDLLVDFWQQALDGRAEAVLHHQQLVLLDAVLRFAYPATAKYLAYLRGVPFDFKCRVASELSGESAKAISVWWEAYQRVDIEQIRA
jgi:4-hydroxy-tetrahydrodipicolinate synthase